MKILCTCPVYSMCAVCPAHHIPGTDLAIFWKLSTDHLITHAIVAIPNFSLKIWCLQRTRIFRSECKLPLMWHQADLVHSKRIHSQLQTITKYRTSCFIFHWIQNTNEGSQNLVDVTFTVLNTYVCSLDHVLRVSCMMLFMAFQMFTCSWRLLRLLWFTQCEKLPSFDNITLHTTETEQNLRKGL
jgi:hypothetical protein